MLAWRRTNVAALNARAPAVMAETGRLRGVELVVDGTGYRAGDRIVTLTPGTNGDTVTSQRGVVIAVGGDTRSLLACMDDGREHRFGTDDIGAGRFGHGYATTVHRSQGATVDAAHHFADGGGRELGYVAMSRARHSSHLHVVADSADRPSKTWFRTSLSSGAKPGQSTQANPTRTPKDPSPSKPTPLRRSPCVPPSDEDVSPLSGTH